MGYGIIEYNEEGQPKCEICGKYFNRVGVHVTKKHHITEKEYKIQFGLDLYKGICSKESAEKSRLKTLSNYDKCITKNLIKKGEKTRFVNGSEGRIKDKVSEQTRIHLIERLKTPQMIEAMHKSGKRLAETGLGNKTRWGK